jgi:hypothetical protein
VRTTVNETNIPLLLMVAVAFWIVPFVFVDPLLKPIVTGGCAGASGFCVGTTAEGDDTRVVSTFAHSNVVFTTHRLFCQSSREGQYDFSSGAPIATDAMPSSSREKSEPENVLCPRTPSATRVADRSGDPELVPE